MPALRQAFFDRGYAVTGAGRFAESLHTAITDPLLAERPPTGSVDQISDNTDVLERPEICRALLSR